MDVIGQKVKIIILSNQCWKGFWKHIFPGERVPEPLSIFFFGRMVPFNRSVLWRESTCMPLLRWIWSWQWQVSCLGLNHKHDRRGTLNMHQKDFWVSIYKITAMEIKAKRNSHKALWQDLAYLLNSEILVPAFSSAQLALTVASVVHLKSRQK